MKRTILLLIPMLLMSIMALAIPAKRGLTRTITLKDGSTMQARLVGDEYGHFWLANNGSAYIQVSDQEYFTKIDAETVKQQAQARRSAANVSRAQRLSGLKKHGRRVGQVGSYFGAKKALVVLVNFTDKKFKATNDSALYDRIANEKDFKEGIFVGSMYDYFYAQSEGQFELTFDIMGPVTVSQKHSYYGSNNPQGDDKHPGEMIHEAIEIVKDSINDWEQYDWDNDGFVDQVYVIYAGNGEADGGASTTIWPHTWDLESSGAGMVSVGEGLLVNTYACGSELNGSNQIGGIGTMCHEFSHCLGYPDFYDIDYSGGQGMDEWDLMSSGSYNGDGYCPAGYTGYERWMAGWKTPVELDYGKVSVEDMKGLQEGGEFYVMYNDGWRDEYFILENRTQTGWDKSLPGSGLLIVHVDYDEMVWAYNQPNDDPDHQRMTWIPSDGSYNFYGYGEDIYPTHVGKDAYPNANGNNAFGDRTTPAAELYNKNTDGSKLLHKGIKNITKHNDGSISFDYINGAMVKVPVFSHKGGIFLESLLLSMTCDTKDAIIYYTTDGSTPTVNSSIYSAPLEIDSDVTVKAIAATAEYESYMTEATYKIVTLISTPDSLNYAWKEDFDGYTAETAAEDIISEQAFYDCDGGQYCKIYRDNLAGGKVPELLIPHQGRPVNKLNAIIALGMVYGDFELSYKSNHPLSISTETEGVVITEGEVDGKTYHFTVTVPEGIHALQLSFVNNNILNTRIDDIMLIKPKNSGGTSGIANHSPSNTQSNDDAYYTIQGVRVAKPTHGIFIHRGKIHICK